MSNLNKRILTSFPLSILAVYAVYNNVILILSLYIISAILIFEISNILKNIFKQNKRIPFDNAYTGIDYSDNGIIYILNIKIVPIQE